MGDIGKLVGKMHSSPKGVRYEDLQKVCEAYFGRPCQRSTSHCLYKTPWPGDPRVNIQNEHGKARAYQVRQILKAIDKMVDDHTLGKK
ncbi:hypothetical protein [Bifidobacterium sp. ESL0764]|uniref:hypothetical protein n=1 Tax=Bifidobacterium sp. ESL0764 TaxID=2983228 RepID=UPI0023F7E633|nr:hypothetical protein [Bifidobacterium sp. ESL0764]WEV66079.1 hypothetical protein OZX71_01615 [Bifidobacterium sp. ESL0764]